MSDESKQTKIFLSYHSSKVELVAHLSSTVLLILAFDMQKANIIRRLLTGSMTAGIPATLLRKHSNAFILTTESVANAAQINEMTTYYQNAKEAAEWIVSK